ncbi:MAG TPA: cupin domain-containing protein [Gaiellaceae bacterium]|jgi:quercetin dioxygenase-like cupin family protein|nr:cupin domain-containing protein [Gaiellaceae bacterium]
MSAWQVADVNEIPPVKEDWPDTWKSVRHHFGITGFGVNAVTKDAGNVLIPNHDETASGQQELYFVHAGAVKATVDGEEVELPAGSFLHCEPEVFRALESTESPTTLLVIGGAPGNAYEVGPWEQ